VAIQVKRLLMVGLLAMATCALMASSGRAADQESGRKTTKKVAPKYPLIARKMLLTGTVRLAALVAPAGQVTSTEVIGGQPILLAAATEAVMQWKYQAAEKESREVLMFSFAPE
jgi:TonB family protein